jgi:AmmeMemoRadiSam system protein B
MSECRRPAVAGQFYPGTARDCREVVQRLLAEPLWSSVPCPELRALIVPHAGYIYSGPTAARAYRLLADVETPFRRVILLGPNHTAPLSGVALPGQSFFASPLGEVAIATDLYETLLELPDVVISDRHHEREHCLEVQLPFLQCCLPEFDLLPAVVGDYGAAQLAELINRCLHGSAVPTLLLISSDLSHFLAADVARQVDGETSKLIESLTPSLDSRQACGCRAINGLLNYATTQGYRVACVDRCTSADTAGGPERVVGYGSYAFW